MDKVRSSAEKQELWKLCSLWKLCNLDCMIPYEHAIVLVDLNGMELSKNMSVLFFSPLMVSLQANIISCFYIWIFFFQVRVEGKVFLWRHLRDKTCLSPQAHPKSSLSKNELSCNDSLLNFIVSSLNIVLFGIRNYFQKCMNEGGSFLTGSSLDINPTEIWRRCFFFFLKLVLYLFLEETFEGFFSAVSVGLSLTEWLFIFHLS